MGGQGCGWSGVWVIRCVGSQVCVCARARVCPCVCDQGSGCLGKWVVRCVGDQVSGWPGV